MKQIVVISGKGGTGKTFLTASFAALAQNQVMVDCDVDAADLHLLLKPEIRERHAFRGGFTARIVGDRCEQCGECLRVCRFDAISEDFRVDAISCEGCAVCSRICPAGAVIMEENVSGEWYVSDTPYGPLVHAKLGIAEENSGKLVAKVRGVAREIADHEGKDYVLIDGPPGIGCPVIAAITGVDLALIVTEPTLTGIHDMERVARVSRHFGIPTMVVINKCDLNPENSQRIREMCYQADIEVAACIPFSRLVIESIVRGIPFVEYGRNGITETITHLWERIR